MLLGGACLRVIMADGHPAMRLGMKGLLLNTEVLVVGEAKEGDAALYVWRRI
jgi:DNA-binding NarL/FixJ family response regulator